MAANQKKYGLVFDTPCGYTRELLKNLEKKGDIELFFIAKSTTQYFVYIKYKAPIEDPTFHFYGNTARMVNPTMGWVTHCARKHEYLTNFFEGHPFMEAVKCDTWEEAAALLVAKRPDQMMLEGSRIKANWHICKDASKQ